MRRFECFYADTVSFIDHSRTFIQFICSCLAYHQKCIDPWLTKNRKVCPICKRKVGPSTGDSDSETEQNTVNNSIATSSRDNEPLLTNVYNNTNQASSSRPSILNIRWLTRGLL